MKKETFLYIYYILLIFLLLTWTDSNNLPPMPLRLAYTAAVTIPLMLRKSLLFPFVFLSIVSLSASRYAPSYMMFRPEYTAIVLLLNHFLFRNEQAKVTPPKAYLFLLPIILLSDLFNDGFPSQCTFTFFCILLLLYYFSYTKTVYKLWTISFIVVSLILSIEFFLFGSNYVEQVIASGISYDRLGWDDPNYFSCMLASGSLLAFQQFINSNNKFLLRIIASVVFAVSFVAIIMMASRGASLALCSGVLVFFLLSDSSRTSKFIVSALVALFIFVLLNNDIFDMLSARVAGDDGTGSGRLVIWETKIQHFFSDGNILKWVFGFGNEGGMCVGSSSKFAKMGFHNDFIAFFVEYGILGLIIFISIFIMPLKNKVNRPTTISNMVFMLIVCMTLEPLTNGRIAYWLFWGYIMYVSSYNGRLELIEK